MLRKVIELPPFGRDVKIRTTSFDEASNSVEVIWTTGSAVRRYSYSEGCFYDEVLEVSSKALRLERLNQSAPFLDTHNEASLRSVIGSVIPGSVEIRSGKGYARVQLSVAPEHVGIVANIRAGVISNISVGYRIHAIEKIELGDGRVAEWRVVDWEPLELSAVPVPADAGAHIRSDATVGTTGKLLSPCVFTETRRLTGAAGAAIARMRMRMRAAKLEG